MSYLNTKPLIFGLEKAPIKDDIELLVDYPSHVAAMLADDRVDIGLIPVAVIPHLPEAHIVTDYCIACDGPVDSVALFSELPLEQVSTVLLDYQSRTSVMLCRLLMQEYWKKDVEWRDTRGEEYRHQIKGDVAGLVIGDRALRQKKASAFMFDLGAAWKAFTGLPFVFATWVSNKPLPASFLEAFNAANAVGLANLEAVVAREQDPPADLMTYYTQNIKYNLDAEKRQGLTSFLSMINTQSWNLTPAEAR